MTQRAINGLYIYFVTTNTTFGQWLFDAPEKAASLGIIIATMCNRFDFVLYGYCILPNHIHLLVRRDGKTPLSKLMNMIKGAFSYSLHGGRFWQPRFNFRIIKDEQRLSNTLQYITNNYQKMDLLDVFGRPPWVYIDWPAVTSWP